MEVCPTTNGNPNGLASDTASAAAPGNGTSSGVMVGGGGKGRKGDMPVKKEPDAGGGIGADGESKGDVDVKLPIHAVATHPVSSDVCHFAERRNRGNMNNTYSPSL
jgi:hypothetical protein